MNTPISARGNLTSALVIALISAVAAAVLLAVPVVAQSDMDNVDQRPVASFIDAGVSIAQAYAPASTTAVVLATDGNFPDGLAASAVAARVGGPVLFTRTDTLPTATAGEIDRLLDADDTVYLMGGESAISAAVASQLDADYTVLRLDGATRLETAVSAAALVGVPASGQVIIARAFGPDGANTPSDRSTGWVDAISCGAFAAANQIPIYLTQTDVLSTATADALAATDATEVIVCGGQNAISEAVADSLRGLGLTIRRVQGPTRVETAIAAAQDLFGFTTAAGNDYTVVNGYGENFGYGLAAAPLGDPILLVGASEPTDCTDASQPSRETLCYLQTASTDDPANLLVVGGPTVIGDPVVEAAGIAAGGDPTPTETPTPTMPPVPPADVDAVDDQNDNGTRATVTWTASADPEGVLAGYNVYVDGVVQGSMTDKSVRTRLLTGLTKDRQVTVTVTAVDTAGQESAMSTGALVTPKDEVPSAIKNFTAQAGAASVSLAWTAGALDFKSYNIGRSAPATGGSCPGASYTELTEITNRDTVTFTDSTAVNGTAYCYQITQTDAADQTSPAADAGPVTPSVGSPQLSVQFPVSDTSPAPGAQPDVVNFGAPLVVRFTVTDTDTPPGDLVATWEMSYDAGGTYVTLDQALPIDFVSDTDDGAATYTIPTCAPGDTTGTRCIRDVDTTQLRLRITGFDGTTTAPGSTGNVAVTRAPPAIENLSGIGGQDQVTLEWDRIPAPTTVVTRYVIQRAEIQVQPDSDASDAACPDSGDFRYSNYDTRDQPAAGATVTYVDPDVDSDGNTLPDGTQVQDFLYCYLVSAQREINATTLLDGPESLTSGNPLVAAGVAVSIQSPNTDGQIRRGQPLEIKYKLELPDGTMNTAVTLQYCLDYEAASGLNSAVCQDANGFTEITAANGLRGTPPAANGNNAVTWMVPNDASTSQGDEANGDPKEGALRVTVTSSNGGGSALIAGLLFR